MLNFHRAAELLFPSVPRRLRAVVTATETPDPVRLGEVRPGSGPATAAVPTTLGDGAQPEGGDDRHTGLSQSPLSGPPSSERCQSEPVHPSLRYQLEDHRLAHLLAEWGATS